MENAPKARCLLLATIVLSPSAINASLYNVGSERQLFIDNAFFLQSNNISLQLHRPTKTNQQVVRPQYPWELATLNWFTVVQDRGVIDTQAKYRMWYECYDVPGWPTTDDTSFCYAESRDGINWTKPKLGLFEYQGSTNNNILFRQIGPSGGHSRVHGTSVFIDPTASPAARYKAVSQGIWDSQSPNYRITEMVSPDGLNWTRLGQPLNANSADSQYSGFWDSNLQKYVIYGRVGSSTGRAIGRAESSDYSQFPSLQQVLQTNGADPADSDLYNPAAMKYAGAANVYMMFPSLYQHGPDTLDIRMAVSRDGVHWTYPDQSKAFIPLGGAGTWDSGSLYMGQGMIQNGNETWLYYSGSPLKHNASDEELFNTDQPRSFSLATLGRDRFVSVDAGSGGGSFVTLPLVFTGDTLLLNVDVHPGGRVRVALLDSIGRPLLGYGLSDCLPITGDQFDALIHWTGGTDLGSLAGQPVRMQVELLDASLYGFQFAEVPEPSSLLLIGGSVAVYASVRRRSL
jgi:hypothetical protein